MKRREFLSPLLALPLAGATSSAAQGAPSRSTTLDIGSDRQLFVDSFLIEEKTGVALKLHPPTAREVALPMEKPWEGNTSWAPVVMKDGSRYRLWYRVDPSVESERSRASPPYTAYAESSDGIHWERPEIGIYEFNGSKRNNLVWRGPGTNMSVLRDDKPGVASRERYKAIVRRPGDKCRHGVGVRRRNPLAPDPKGADPHRRRVRLPQHRVSRPLDASIRLLGPQLRPTGAAHSAVHLRGLHPLGAS